MNAAEILALQSGQPLDATVHSYIFNNAGPVLPYSTESAVALGILDRLPLFVGRVAPTHPKIDPARPWISGTLTHEPSFKGDVTALRVTGPTLAIALCKAALIFTMKPATGPAPRAAAQPRSNPASEQAARDVARRVGTKRARNPKAEPETPPARNLRADKSGSKPAFNRPQQPAAHRSGGQLAPMPKRPGKWVGPTPLPVAGSGMPKA